MIFSLFLYLSVRLMLSYTQNLIMVNGSWLLPSQHKKYPWKIRAPNIPAGKHFATNGKYPVIVKNRLMIQAGESPFVSQLISSVTFLTWFLYCFRRFLEIISERTAMSYVRILCYKP